MIFVTLGSQKFQFNRLLKKIDELIEDRHIEEEVFAQIGYSDYKPQHYKYKEFLDREEFTNIMESCHIVITHGGTGAVITAVKQGKKTIAVPRLAKYGEHVDDHQLQILTQFNEMNIITSCLNLEKLSDEIKSIGEIKFDTYKSNTRVIIESIEQFIEK